MKKSILVSLVAFAFSLLPAQAQLPAVTLKTMNGAEVRTDTLSNGGKPFIIDFFATWCKPCNRELDAISEVYEEWQEETGVDQLELRDLICVTDHCYLRDGIWHLKHTWWYDMLYTDPVNLTPQREEDITRAAWVARSSLPPYLKNTYPSIQEVFREVQH